MPIKGEIKENLLKEIKETEQPEKLRLVGLYRQLQRIYEKDDEYSRNTTAFAFETHEKLRNLSTKAMQIMKNEEPINEAELTDKDQFFTPEELESEEYKTAFNGENPKQIPHFWLHLLQKIQKSAFMIKEQDEEVLKHLQHLDCIKNQNNTDYTLEFIFSENEYFTNQKLTIYVKMEEDEDTEVETIKADKINWKEGKNVLVTKIKKRNKKGKTVFKEKRNESFFWIFKDYNANDFQVNEEDEMAEYDMDPTADRSLFEMTYDFVDFISKDFFPFYIPACYDVHVPAFEDELIEEDEANEGGNGAKQQHGCSQQ